MRDIPTPPGLEGRLLAHRKLLARLMAGLDEARWQAMEEWLAEREVLQDGQEDPGAVPGDALGFALGLSNELHAVAEMARTLRRRPDAG